MIPERTDILIVGAGPAGLALAVALRQAGLDPLLIDRLEAGRNTSRAAVIHAHTLEMLDGLGVTARLKAEGLAIARFTARERGRRLLGLGFAKLPSPHPYLLMVPQDVTERVLEERLAELGGRVHRGVSAEAVTQDESGATVWLTTPDGPREVRANWVVGADGMHSAVREAARIGFPGGTYEDGFVLADVRMRWPFGRDEVSLLFSPRGLVVVAPLPKDRFRVVATMDDAPENPTRQHIQSLLDARGPETGGIAVEEVIWSSRFRVHHRVVDSYRAGRILLLGDAAHVHSPAGGQGMNTGLVDAVVLGEALARVAKGEPENLLDRYAAIRRPAAEEVLALAGRLTRVATVKSAAARWFRNRALRLLNRLPPVKRRLVAQLSGISRRASARLA